VTEDSEKGAKGANGAKGAKKKQRPDSDAPPASDVHVRAIRLSKWYGKVTALQDVSLHLEPGVWGLLGPNGSGKTTFLRCVGGQLKPSLGEVRVCGEKPFANPDALKRVGLCPEADAMYDDLTGLEFVTFMAKLSGYSQAEAEKRAKDALEAFGLTKAMTRKIGGYSRGMRQRAKLAQAVVHDPDVLLLDEPLTGTDPTSRAVILEQVKKRADDGALVIFSTHVLPEVEAITDRVLLIARGQVVAQGRVHEIRDLLEEHPHHVRVRCDRPRDLAAALMKVEGVVGVHFPAWDTVELATRAPDETYSAIAKEAVLGGFKVAAITSPDASLEALFHYLVERSGRMAGTGADAGGGSVMAPTYAPGLSPGQNAGAANARGAKA
jgi:ABC-2 type transport system ATP-binding protein